MSELTQCNYCSLQAIKKAFEEAKIVLKVKNGWIEVCRETSQGKYKWLGVSFLALTLECVC